MQNLTNNESEIKCVFIMNVMPLNWRAVKTNCLGDDIINQILDCYIFVDGVAGVIIFIYRR